MKFIREYKIFETELFQLDMYAELRHKLELLKIEIEDILLELSDIGYNVNCDLLPVSNVLVIYISKKPLYVNNALSDYYSLVPIEFEEVEDCVDRLIEYLISKNFLISLFLKNSHYVNLFKVLDLKEITNLEEIKSMHPHIWKYRSIQSIQINTSTFMPNDEGQNKIDK